MNRCLKKEGFVFLEMAPYYSLISGHHLYTYTFLPAQYLPKSFVKWWLFKKKPNKTDTPQSRWESFITLNKITVSHFKKLAVKNGFKILEENYIFKVPEKFSIKINWIKYFGFLKEMIPMSYQAVLVKK